MYGFGLDIAQEFNAATVWADAVAGGACWTAGNPLYGVCVPDGAQRANLGEAASYNPALCGNCANAASRAAQRIQAALNKLGYGPLKIDGDYGGLTEAAFKRFLVDQHQPPRTHPIEADLRLMQSLLQSGSKPGPGASVNYLYEGGAFVEKKGLSTTQLAVGALVVGGVGYWLWKRKR